MTTLKVHHQGWLALPERFCQKLGVEHGGQLEAELVDSTVVLRSAKQTTKGVRATTTAEATGAIPAPSVLAAQAQDTGQPADAPPAPKRRGRPPKARPAGG